MVTLSGEDDRFMSQTSLVRSFMHLSESIVDIPRNLVWEMNFAGAHTIGRAHCSAFSSRLYPTVDPTLDPAYAAQLQAACPPNANPNIRVPLDLSTPDAFDNNYYTNLPIGRSLMPSDAALLNDGFSTRVSEQNSQNSQFWTVKFANAMFRMSQLNMKLGLQGEIRQNCRFRG